MEMIMTKTTETSNLEHHDTSLADSELASVSGGLVVPSIIGILVGPGSTGPYTSVKEPTPAKHWFNGG
jgi:hypothetical protein